jgi:hypothetical protein
MTGQASALSMVKRTRVAVDGVDALQALVADGRARSDGFPLAGGSFKGVHMPRSDPLAKPDLFLEHD